MQTAHPMKRKYARNTNDQKFLIWFCYITINSKTAEKVVLTCNTPQDMKFRISPHSQLI